MSGSFSGSNKSKMVAMRLELNISEEMKRQEIREHAALN